MTGERARRDATHIALRLAVAAALLGAALVVEIRTPGTYPVNPFFFLIAVIFAVSLVFIGLLRFADRWPWLADVQFAFDVLAVSAFVFLTGGIGSLFVSLYLLPIVAASAMQSRRGALQVAALSSVVYAGLVLAQYLEAAADVDLPLGLRFDAPLLEATVAQYTVGFNVFGFFAVAFVAGSLAERLRRADVRLVEASEAIADIEALNEYVIDNLVSGLATADARNRMMSFNRSAVLITGVPLKDALGADAAAVLQLPPEFTATLDDDLRRSRSRRTDFQYTRADGRLIDLGLAAAQLPLPDGSGYLYTFQDVTDVRRLERRAQLQQRLAAVGEMAAGIAHEIRNPLASMSGSMQLLRQELPLSGDQAQLMDIVLRESERLNETIRSFLAYARPQPHEMTRLDLRDAVRETATLLGHSTELGERHAVEVVCADVPLVVDADGHQIRQIVWNLATNGLRAMPDGGTLRLVAAATPDGAPELRVEDEGVGIPPGEIDTIFQPFTGSFGKGTGLGLAIVHRLVSDHGGRIEVVPGAGRGTTFRVLFPAPRARGAARHAS